MTTKAISDVNRSERLLVDDLRACAQVGSAEACCKYLMRAADEIERLRGVEADARRYRYWRKHHGWTGYFDDGATNSEDGDDVDAAIDAAIAASRSTGAAEVVEDHG